MNDEQRAEGGHLIDTAGRRLIDYALRNLSIRMRQWVCQFIVA
jgi:hypothetical protein